MNDVLFFFLSKCLKLEILYRYTDNLPNTYIFTKGLAENACEDYKDRVPISIFRPAIVVGIEKEPLPGWVANFNGPAGLMTGAGSGLIRTFLCDTNCPLYCTPADTCINAIIVAAWKKGVNLDKDVLPIYNCATGKSSVDEMTGKTIRDAALEYPLSQAFWVPNGYTTNSKILFFFLNLFWHVIPAIILDTVLKISGKPPMYVIK